MLIGFFITLVALVLATKNSSWPYEPETLWYLLKNCLTKSLITKLFSSIVKNITPISSHPLYTSSKALDHLFAPLNPIFLLLPLVYSLILLLPTSSPNQIPFPPILLFANIVTSGVMMLRSASNYSLTSIPIVPLPIMSQPFPLAKTHGSLTLVPFIM